MIKRELALKNARIAGYNNDKSAFTKIIIESKVNLQELNKMWELGRKHLQIMSKSTRKSM